MEVVPLGIPTRPDVLDPLGILRWDTAFPSTRSPGFRRINNRSRRCLPFSMHRGRFPIYMGALPGGLRDLDNVPV